MSLLFKVLTFAGFMAASVVLSASLASANGRGKGDRGNDKGNPHAAVPEISAAGAPAAIAFVLGGVAVVLGRRARRNVMKSAD
jgi:hypothetical protein